MSAVNGLHVSWDLDVVVCDDGLGEVHERGSRIHNELTDGRVAGGIFAYSILANGDGLMLHVFHDGSLCDLSGVLGFVEIAKVLGPVVFGFQVCGEHFSLQGRRKGFEESGLLDGFHLVDDTE